MPSKKLLEKTDRELAIREIVVLGERHEDFLRDLLEEVEKRTTVRLNKSTVMRTLIETVADMGLDSSDITKVYRARRNGQDLEGARGTILGEIECIESDLRLALIDEPTETMIIRQYRRNLRYQRERLKAVEAVLAEAGGGEVPAPPEQPAAGRDGKRPSAGRKPRHSGR